MSNTQKERTISTLIEQKTRVLLKELDQEYAQLRSNEQEEILLKYNNVYKKILNTAAQPLTINPLFRKGVTIEAGELNAVFQNIENDLKIIFKEMTHLSSELRDTYNTLLTKEYRLRSKIAETTSSIMDYALVSQQNSNNIILDNFLNLNKAESNPDKFKKEKMFINSDIQAVSLPVVSDDKKIELESISINPLSNGVLGNNQEVNAILNDDLTKINDDNIDTWVEYEHVQKDEHTTSLIFEFELKFKEVTFFNWLEIGIHIFPNGSGPVIAEMSGSVDGEYYINLMDDFLGIKEVDARGQEVIPLGANEDNPQDLNDLLFFPRKIKYLKIKLVQDSDYLIRTISGIKHRLAIGIKEIKCKGIKFKNEGEFQSISFPTSREVKKVSLETNEYIPDGFIVTNEYEISHDAGQTWNPITPLNKTNLDIPEILTYNIEYLKESINTKAPVRNLKLKLKSKIELDSSDSAPKSVKQLSNKSEFKTVAGGVQSIILEEKPEQDVEIYHVGFGSVGEGNFYMIPDSDFYDMDDYYLAKLPLEVFSRNKIKPDTEIVYIDDIVWKRVDDLMAHESTERVYEFDYVNSQIYFHKKEIIPSGTGDPDTIIRHGKKPIGNIYFKIKAEQPIVKELADVIQLKTIYDHNGIKDQIKVYEKEIELEHTTLRFTPYSQTQKMVNGHIETITIVQDNNNKLQNEKEFVNGYFELENPGDYSIDKDRGMFYLYEIIQPEDIIEIDYGYKKMNSVNFDIIDNEIAIKKEDYKDHKKKEEVQATNSQSIQLTSFPIKRGSLKVLTETNLLQTEIPFNPEENPFNNIEDTTGCYTVDYNNGRILFPELTSITLEVEYSYYDYYVNYGISLKIPKTDYTIDREAKRITFSDDFVLRFFSDSLGINNNKMFKINYQYLIENVESPNEILPFLTPLLYDYRMKIIFKD